MSIKTREKLTLRRDRDGAEMPSERLHKVLAHAGLGSRRALEERITQGQVKVNTQVAELGSTVTRGDRIEVDGKSFVVVPDEALPRVLVYHKPEGELTTRDDPEGRATVFDRLPPIKGARWIAIGRLDINTTGLLLLTTDGELANRLMHPSGNVEREYVCRIQGEVDDAMLERLKQGVTLDDGPAHFDTVEIISQGEGSHAWFKVVLGEGRNREVRRLWESQGVTVSRLKRVRYGSVELPRHLRRGRQDEMAAEQVRALIDALPGGQGLGAALTLQPVIGQRRGKTQEFRPQGGVAAWTGEGHEDAAEFRAFDRPLDPLPTRRRPGQKYKKGKAGAGRGGPRPGGPRPGGGQRPGGPRPAGRPGARKGGPGGPRGPGGGQARGGGGGGLGTPGNAPGRPRKGNVRPGYDNPTEFRTWYVPEGGAMSPFIEPKGNSEERSGNKPRRERGSDSRAGPNTADGNRAAPTDQTPRPGQGPRKQRRGKPRRNRRRGGGDGQPKPPGQTES